LDSLEKGNKFAGVVDVFHGGERTRVTAQVTPKFKKIRITNTKKS